MTIKPTTRINANLLNKIRNTEGFPVRKLLGEVSKRSKLPLSTCYWAMARAGTYNNSGDKFDEVSRVNAALEAIWKEWQKNADKA